MIDHRVKKLSYTLALLMGGVTPLATWAADNAITLQREQAVILARNGQLDAAIIALKKLHTDFPQEGKVSSDLLVLLRQAGRNGEIGQLTDQSAFKQLADYAYLPWASALRDLKRYGDAARILAPVKDRLGVKAQILYATVRVENNQPQAALAALPQASPLKTRLDANDYAQMAYVYRMAKQPVNAVQMSRQALKRNPHLALAQQELRQALAAIPDPLSVAREQAILLARKGKLDIALAKLRRLHRLHPSDIKIGSDLIMLLRQAGLSAEIGLLTDQGALNSLAPYAYLPMASALRDLDRYDDALRLLEPVRGRLGIKADILYATLCAESNRSPQALAVLTAINTTAQTKARAVKLDADDYAQMAYVYRLIGQPMTGLQMGQRARLLNADLPLAIQQTSYALSDIGAPDAALHLAEQTPTLFPAESLYSLQVDATALNLRNAVAERYRLESGKRVPIRNLPLDAVLAEIDHNIAFIPADSPQSRRSLFDRVYALRVRERMLDCIQAYQALPVTQAQTPAYVRRAAADAYLATKQPLMAHALYQPLMTEPSDAALYLADYYALIDSEDYDQAASVLAKISRITSAIRISRAVDKKELPNWERLDVDQTLAMDAAYRNHLDDAQQQIATLSAHAPRNVTLLNNYATILRWRGLPQAADRVTELAMAYEPDDSATRLTIANNARDLEQIPRWRQAIVPLRQLYPDDSSIEKNDLSLLDRDRPSISSELSLGSSSGGQHITDLNGSSDLDWQTRINTPWLQDDWRGFVQLNTRRSDFNAQSAQDNRAGVGAEWSSERRNARLMMSGQVGARGGNDNGNNGHDTHGGVSGGWSQWLNDQWQYTINASSDVVETPLRALNAGISAKDAALSVKWQQNESRSAYLSTGFMGFSDGNQRVSFSAGLTQRLQAGPHDITTVGLGLYSERNSQPGKVYFTPAQTLGESAFVQHDWVTWRNYEHSLTQRIKLSAGLNTQSNYGSAVVADVLYQHLWQLSRTWKLNYGMNFGTPIYDGQRERRVAAILGFEGVF
jgi:poly-beta-1,6 N-acetyl-D-glucosamine export porin PgaA